MTERDKARARFYIWLLLTAYAGLLIGILIVQLGWF